MKPVDAGRMPTLTFAQCRTTWTLMMQLE